MNKIKLYTLHSNPQQLYAYDKLANNKQLKELLIKLHRLIDTAYYLDFLQQDLAKKMHIDSDTVYDRFNDIESIVSDAESVLDELEGLNLVSDYEHSNMDEKSYKKMSLAKKLKLLIDTANDVDALQQELFHDMNVSDNVCRNRHFMLSDIVDDAQDIIG